MYYINYQTGHGNGTAETLEQAMELADANARYTQNCITIHRGKQRMHTNKRGASLSNT